MVRAGVKVTLYNACPQAIIADTAILAEAPERMLQAGLGDMLAKYLSALEWRLSHLVTGEYYCDNVAALMRRALQRIVESAPGLMSRSDEAIERVFEGLILSGIAMGYAKISRPASGLEHYFSHLWEMMALERHKPQQLHGIQVGVGTLLTLRIWEHLRQIRPDKALALRARERFDEAAWQERIRRVFGGTAPAIISAAEKSGRNDREAHRRRLEVIVAHWDEILTMARRSCLPISRCRPDGGPASAAHPGRSASPIRIPWTRFWQPGDPGQVPDQLPALGYRAAVHQGRGVDLTPTGHSMRRARS